MLEHPRADHSTPPAAPAVASKPPTKHEAYAFLGSLKVGERVLYVSGGREQEVTVQDSLWRPSGFGSWDGDAVVKVGYGPGRWNTEVSAGRLALGFIALRRPQTAS